jgi:FkbM family methyltransferase
MDTIDIKGYRVAYFNGSELENIRREIFNEGIYNLRLDTDKPFIIDGGAHIGMATIFFKSQYPKSQILAIEPNPRSFKLLQTNVEQNDLQNVTLMNSALGPKEGTKTLYIDPTDDRWDSSASFHHGGWTGGHNTKDIQVPTVSLSSLIMNRRVDLLKLDIEGAEQKVLIEAEQHLGNIKNIIIEFHPVGGQNLQKIVRLLRKNGFEVEVGEGKELRMIRAKAS